MKRFIPYLLMFCLTFSACEKEYSWNFKAEDLGRVVVDGIITNELRPQEIRLSYSNPDLNQPVSPLSDAIVRVNDNATEYEFIESAASPGLYVSAPFQAVIDQEYHLTIILQTDTFEASSGIEPVTPLEGMQIYHDSTRNLSRFIFQGWGRPAMTKVYYDWSVDTAYCSDYGYCSAQESYYVLRNTDINDIFAPDQELIFFPSGTRIIRQKFSLTESHQEFIRSLLMETDWSGGIFDVQHGNVRTNLSNGALGYFAACMVVSDTTIIE